MSAGPWSVKGIDPRARARAKTAARRQGLTLGEWLNRVILDDGADGSPDWDSALEAFPGFSAADGLNADEDRLLRAMVTRLAERVEDGEQSQSRALGGMDQAVRALAEKVNAAETARQKTIEETRAIVERVKQGQASLDRRVDQLEKDGAESSLAPDTVRTVETAMAKLAKRLYFSESEIGGRIDGAEEAADRAQRTAENLDERIARLEKRGEDLADLSKRRSNRAATALNGLHRAADGLARRVEAAEQLAHDSARAFDGAIDRIEDRVRSIEMRNGDPEFELRFDRLSEDVARTIADTRSQLAGALEQAASEPRVDRLETALAAALDRIDSAERRHAESLSRIGEEVARMAQAVDKRITDSEARAAEKAQTEQAERALDERFDAVRRENRSAIKQMGEQMSRMGKTLADRLHQTESRSAQAVEDAAGRMAAMVERLEQNNASEAQLDERLRESEERTAERIESALDGVRARLDQARAETAETLTPVERTMTALAERLEAIEKRATEKPAPDAEKKPEAELAAADLSSPLQQPPEARTAPAGPVTLEAQPAAQTAAQSVAQPAPAADPFEGFAEPAAPQPQAQSQPQAQAQPRTRPPLEPAPPLKRRSVLGATADADFLAAARQRTRPSSGVDYDMDPDGGGKGRAIIAGLSVAAFLAVGAAAAWVVMTGGGQQVPAATASTAPVEALLLQPGETPPGDAQSAAPAPAAVEEDEVAPVRGEDTPPAATLPQGSDPADAEARLAAAPVATPPARVQTPPPAPRVTLQSAAADGDPVARYLLGMQALENGNTDTAVPLLRRAAEQDVPAAQYRYGKLLETGEGVVADASAARRWTERAAQAGHRRAMHNLGIMYAIGFGMESADPQLAFQWFERAARLGLADSQFNLASLYQRGQGTPQSIADAYAWFLIAAESNGDEAAAEQAAILARDLPPAAVTEARAAAQGFSPQPLDEAANGVYRDLPWEQGPGALSGLVLEVQTALNTLGYDAGPADGVMGGRTRRAVMAYEADQGLPRTGRVDAVLRDRLSRAVAG
jgi:localization factor PodJL